jgi:hypothetical protein
LKLRIARGRNERLHSARQVLRIEWLPDDVRGQSEETVRVVKETAVRWGFKITTHDWIEEDRPSFTRLLRWMLGEDLGGTVANYYSAVTHGTQYGLASAVIDVVSSDHLGPPTAVIGLSSSDVSMALGVAGLGLIRAFESERLLMGRDWPHWDSVVSATLSAFESAFERQIAAELEES